MKRKINNKPFYQLINTYRSIALKELLELDNEKDSFAFIDFVKNRTGFGHSTTCILCTTFDTCRECYKRDKGKSCMDGEHASTYSEIYRACYWGTAEEVFAAINARADHIEEWLAEEF